MHRLIIVVGALLGVALLAAPFVAGARISRRRHRAGFAAVEDWHSGGFRTLGVPVEPETAWANRYEAVVGAAHQTCAEEIGRALDRFVAAGRTHYGEEYAPLIHGEPRESITIAMDRLRYGVGEPVAARIAAAYDDTTRDTGRLYHPADLLRILGLEPVSA